MNRFDVDEINYGHDVLAVTCKFRSKWGLFRLAFKCICVACMGKIGRVGYLLRINGRKFFNANKKLV